MLCENCNNEYFSKYGSGRFCSSKCARSYSTKNKRHEINQTVSEKLSKPVIEKICKNCNTVFFTKRKVQTLCSQSCNVDYLVKISPGLNKGKKKPKLSYTMKQQYAYGKQVIGGTTKWYQYKNIKVQGSYELRACYILDRMKDLKMIDEWEYTSDRIQYIGEDNKTHSYLLDFKIQKRNKTFYVETKGYKTNRDELKWKAAKEQNIKILIWYEKQLSRLESVVSLV